MWCAVSALHKTPEEREAEAARKELERAERKVTDHGGPRGAGTGYNRDLERARERMRDVERNR